MNISGRITGSVEYAFEILLDSFKRSISLNSPLQYEVFWGMGLELELRILHLQSRHSTT
jgi:hypothetical protein